MRGQQTALGFSDNLLDRWRAVNGVTIKYLSAHYEVEGFTINNKKRKKYLYSFDPMD
jgi:hypothetical protein